jgi:DNA-binding transcriptional MerR regulator
MAFKSDLSVSYELLILHKSTASVPMNNHQHNQLSQHNQSKQTGSESDNTNGTYRSGAAARLSGVPVETLRVWERRYGVTDPSRSESGQRQYSFDDVRRLGLIKQLVDAGNSIGALANLELQQLIDMLDAAASLPSAQSASQFQLENGLLKIALVGVMLRQSLINIDPTQSKLNLVQTALNLTQAPLQLKDVKVDVLVVEQGELAAPEEQIPLLNLAQQACDATAVLVLYRFASSDAVRQLRLAGFHVARIPAEVQEIDHLCRVVLARVRSSKENRAKTGRAKSVEKVIGVARNRNKNQDVIPERLFDDDHLMHIAKSAASIHCECPRHLVELLQMLTSFERYSAQCANRNEDDAKLHHDLHHTAAQARFSLEHALMRVAQAEGISYQ